MRRRLKSFGHKPDIVLLSSFFILVVLGLIFLASASFDIGKIDFNDTYYFLKHQLVFGFVPGVVMFLIGYLVYYRNWRKFSPVLFFLNLILLVMVLTPIGTVINGSRRWISLFGISFQPSEFLNLFPSLHHQLSLIKGIFQEWTHHCASLSRINPLQ